MHCNSLQSRCPHVHWSMLRRDSWVVSYLLGLLHINGTRSEVQALHEHVLQMSMLPHVSTAVAQCCKPLSAFCTQCRHLLKSTWECFCYFHKMWQHMCVALGCTGLGRAHAAEKRKERESLEELIHSIQLESELTSRALRQSVSVRCFYSPAVSPWLLLFSI